MKKFLPLSIVMCLIAGHSLAQTAYEVTVSDFSFQPAVLEIFPGDTVRWSNEQGNHNINGSVADFPDNPEEFGNEVGQGWTYEFVFSDIGSYGYNCMIHPNQMIGSIEVVSPSQTIHEVSVTNFQYTPANLEIEEGDIVRWTNNEGTHNVNGTFETFPDNPMEFSNEVSSDNWIYEVTFTDLGNYDYRCDQHPSQMEGTIVVSEITGIEDAPEQEAFYALFPNPVVNQLNWRWEKDNVPANSVLVLYNSEGKQVDRFSMRNKSSRDMSKLSHGLYQYIITSDDEEIQTGKLLIQRQ